MITDCNFQYNIFSLIFSWFTLASTWLTFSIITNLLAKQGYALFGTATAVGGYSLLVYHCLVSDNLHVDSLGQLRFQMYLSILSHSAVHSRPR